jgi:hypothetical protein
MIRRRRRLQNFFSYLFERALSIAFNQTKIGKFNVVVAKAMSEACELWKVASNVLAQRRRTILRKQK